MMTQSQSKENVSSAQNNFDQQQGIGRMKKPNKFAIPVEDLPLVDQLITEDDEPVDSILAAKQQRLLIEPLYSSLTRPLGKRKFVADTNVGLFYAVREPPLVPDMFLSLDVQLAENFREKRHCSYFLWEFGKPPDVVIEIVTGTDGEEEGKKWQGYVHIEVPYYVIFDPLNKLGKGVLRLYELHDTEYVLLTPSWLPKVGLGLTLWTGEFEMVNVRWLRWCDKEGKILPTGAESTRQLREEREQIAKEREEIARERKQIAMEMASPNRRMI